MIESYNKYHQIKKKRFLNEGVFSDFIREKHLNTTLTKFKKICKENKKNISLGEYTFFNNEYRDSRKVFSHIPNKQIINFLSKKKVIYFPEFDRFYILSDYKQNIEDMNLKFMSLNNVEKNSIELEEVIEKIFPKV